MKDVDYQERHNTNVCIGRLAREVFTHHAATHMLVMPQSHWLVRSKEREPYARSCIAIWRTAADQVSALNSDEIARIIEYASDWDLGVVARPEEFPPPYDAATLGMEQATKVVFIAAVQIACDMSTGKKYVRWLHDQVPHQEES